jgi:hypothetical protein
MHNGTCQFLTPKNKRTKEGEEEEFVYRFRVATFIEEDFLKLTYGIEYLFFRKVELLTEKLIIYVVWF